MQSIVPSARASTGASTSRLVRGRGGGQGSGPRLRRLRQLGQLLAPEVLRHGPDRVDGDDALDPRLRQDVVGDGAVVVDGHGVGHAGGRGEASRRRRAGARRDRLLVLVPGFAQVDVDVDEARADDLAPGVHELGAGRRGEALADTLDLPVGDEDVLDGVDAVRGIDHAPVPDEEAHAAAAPLLPARSSSTPIRTATPLATWSRITEYGPSASSGESSTPRLTGPGCMMSTSGRACRPSLSSVSPQ